MISKLYRLLKEKRELANVKKERKAGTRAYITVHYVMLKQLI